MISHPALDRMQLIATPLVETSAHALAKKAADSLPVTPLVGTEIDVGEVHRMSDVAGLGDASFPPGATDGIQPVAVDSVIAVNFKASVDDRLVWGQNTPAGMGTQSSGEVSTQYELVELGIRRRAHTGPDAGVWTTLVDPALSRLESLIGLTPAEIAARLVPVVSLLWDGDVQREDKLDPRRLLVNAEVPFLTAEVNFEADEALVRTGGGWPCCRVRRKPRWHTLDYRDVPVGERAPATKEFTESHSTLHWLGAPPPVVGPALLSPGGEPVARVSPSAPAQTPFARMSFDEPASIVDIVILWRAMHLNRSLVVTPFRGLEVLPERTLKLSSPNLTRILLNEPDGITHVLLRFEGPAVGFAAAAAVDWLELSQVRYRARAEVLNDLLDAQRCNQTNDSAASGGKRFAWMANHDYELSLRTRVTVKDERSGSLLKELQQKLFFVTKGLPGLNAVARIGEELEPYVESRYAPADVPLYQAEPVVLAFNERYDVFAALEHPPSAADPPERKQAHDLVLAIEKIGGGGTEWRISQTAPDWIVAHRTIPPPPSGPGRRPPYVIGVSVLDPIVREGTREAPSLDPLSVRFDAVLASPSSCGLSEPPARKSRTLSHDAVDPDDPDVTPRRWPAQTVLRASVRRKDAPFVERTPFEPGDEVGLTRVGGAAWTVTDGAIGPDSGATSRQLALFGEASWEHLTARVAIDPAGVEAGVAVAVGGFPLGSRALLALVDPAAGRLRLVARHGGVDAELASAELTVTGRGRARGHRTRRRAPCTGRRRERERAEGRPAQRTHGAGGDGRRGVPRTACRRPGAVPVRADHEPLRGSRGARRQLRRHSARVPALGQRDAHDRGASRRRPGPPDGRALGQARAPGQIRPVGLRARAAAAAARRAPRAEPPAGRRPDRPDPDRKPRAASLDRRRQPRRRASGRGPHCRVDARADAEQRRPHCCDRRADGLRGAPTTLQKATYRLRFDLDRPRYRSSPTDVAGRFQQEATLDVDL